MKDDYEFDAPEYEDELDESEQEHDEENDEFWTQYGMPAVTTLRFTYEDGAGKRSERLVDVKLFAESAWGPQLIGHCHTRSATRTFKVDRIKNCVDETSNTQVSDVYNHLFDLYEKTPEYSFDQVAEKHVDTLRAALHIAGCAALTESEQASIIRQVCQQLSGDKRIGAESVSRFLSQYSGSQASGVDQTFRLIAGRLNKSLSPNNKETVIRLCTKIAGIKGPINAGSQESIDYLAKRFAKPE